MAHVLKEICDHYDKLKKQEIPNKLKETIGLNKDVTKYLEMFGQIKPHELGKVLEGNTNDPIMANIGDTAGMLNEEEMFNFLEDLVKALDKAEKEAKKQHDLMEKGQTGGTYIMNISFGADVLPGFYVQRHIVPSIVMSRFSLLNPNFFISQSRNFAVARTFAMKHLTGSNIISESTDNQLYRDHIEFMRRMDTDSSNYRIYRYIDRDILYRNISILRRIKKGHHNFYENFKYTFDLLDIFCGTLMGRIDDNIIDIDLLDYDRLNTTNQDIMNLNYGMVLLNYFKILIDTVEVY